MILLCGRQASPENHLGTVPGAKVDQAGILSVLSWPGKSIMTFVIIIIIIKLCFCIHVHALVIFLGAKLTSIRVEWI